MTLILNPVGRASGDGFSVDKFIELYSARSNVTATKDDEGKLILTASLSKDQLFMDNKLDFAKWGKNHGNPDEDWTRDYQVDLWGGDSEFHGKLMPFPMGKLGGRASGWGFTDDSVIAPTGWRLTDGGLGVYGLSTYITVKIVGLTKSIKYKRYSARRANSSESWEVYSAIEEKTINPSADAQDISFLSSIVCDAKTGLEPNWHYNTFIEFIELPNSEARIYVSELDNDHRQWARVMVADRNLDYESAMTDTEHGGGLPVLPPIPDPPPPPRPEVPEGYEEQTLDLAVQSGSATLSGGEFTSTTGDSIIKIAAKPLNPASSVNDMYIYYDAEGDAGFELHYMAMSNTPKPMRIGVNEYYKDQFAKYFDVELKLTGSGKIKNIQFFVKWA